MFTYRLYRLYKIAYLQAILLLVSRWCLKQKSFRTLFSFLCKFFILIYGFFLYNIYSVYSGTSVIQCLLYYKHEVWSRSVIYCFHPILLNIIWLLLYAIHHSLFQLQIRYLYKSYSCLFLQKMCICIQSIIQILLQIPFLLWKIFNVCV